MPAPIVVTALSYAAVAGAAYALSRRQARAQPDRHERTLDDLPEGLSADAGRTADGMRGDGHVAWTRDVRFGADGPGFRVDARALGRFRLTRLPQRA